MKLTENITYEVPKGPFLSVETGNLVLKIIWKCEANESVRLFVFKLKNSEQYEIGIETKYSI